MKGIKDRELEAVGNLLHDVAMNLEILIGKAETYKEERSEKWAESDAGEEYETKIEQLQQFLDSTEELRDEIIDFTNED